MRDGRQIIEKAQRSLDIAAKMEGATVIAFCADGSVYLLKKPQISLPLDVAEVRRARASIKSLMDNLGVP